jgi:RHS repeat-associated protein
MGNLTQVIEPNPAGGADLVTNYTYNGADKLVQVSMTRGATTQIRTFVYNANNQLQSATNPETGTVTYTYNANGTVATKTDAKNQVTGYTYDTYKRVTKITRAGDACQTVDYWYDANPHDGAWSVNTWGRVAAVQYGGQSCQGGLFQEFYKYTAAGLPTAKKLRFWRNDSWYELASAHGYDNEGRNTSITYPGHYVDDYEEGWVWRNGPTYTYTFDAMGRPTKLTEGGANPIDWVKEVTYNVAGQITQMKYPRTTNWHGAYLVETRSYNNRMEMTRLTVLGGETDWEYRYSATQNNGQITQVKDWVTGEEVTYQYDSLKRLISAVTTGPDWGLSFSYDGFGNKTGQNVTKGSAPVMNLTYNEPTNRINSVHGFVYDANGNVTAMPSMTNTYDAANRLTQVVHNSTGTQQYGYAPDNKRVWHKDAQNQEFFQYYDVSGKRLGSYRIHPSNYYLTISYTTSVVAATNVYFGSKMIVSEGRTVILDRLGSVRLREPQGGCCLPLERVNYFPYGEGMTSAARNFATYERSASTGVDYADQRYYSGIHGRFLTADPYVASAGVSQPGSWNRYAYVENDPINYHDPEGLLLRVPDPPPGTTGTRDTEPQRSAW